MKNKIEKNKWVIAVAILLLIIVTIGGIYRHKYNQCSEVNYTNFLQMLDKNEIERVDLGNEATFTFYKKGDSTKYYTDNPRKQSFKEELLVKGVPVEEHVSSVSTLQYAMSSIMMLTVLFLVFRIVKKGGLSKSNQMALNSEVVTPDKLKVGFDSIAGNIEAKEQMRDLIDFIKTPDKYTKLGAKMPKGIILYGPPGTGKTLMAKAIAKEAGVPFFSVSGSDFVQLYAGVGASRVRELFKEAGKHEKAVIFIDEIDAIGKKRSQNVMQGNDEKDQTLNALLTAMSGFKENTGIVVIAATNRLDILDEALLRPGRFDRQIEIGYPDINAREAIIKLYLKDRPVADEVSSYELAKQTVYFTGAMLEHLVNEAAIEAANKGAQAIYNVHLESAFYTVIAGKEKKDRTHISIEDQKITAYHEAGHALITKLLAPENSISKVTIIPSTKGAGGFSVNIPKDRLYLSKQQLIARIKIALAGRVAEELIFGEEYITTGASNDIERATHDLKQLQLKYGMDAEIGMINLGVLTGQEQLVDSKWVEKSCIKMQELYEETKSLMIENQRILSLIADALLEQETLNEQQIASFF